MSSKIFASIRSIVSLDHYLLQNLCFLIQNNVQDSLLKILDMKIVLSLYLF